MGGDTTSGRARRRSRAVQGLWACFALVPGLPTPGALAQVPCLLRACAAYDLHALALIEEQGLSGESENVAIAAAMTALVEARSACREGRAELAFDLYDRATLDRASRSVMGSLRP